MRARALVGPTTSLSQQEVEERDLGGEVPRRSPTGPRSGSVEVLELRPQLRPASPRVLAEVEPDVPCGLIVSQSVRQRVRRYLRGRSAQLPERGGAVGADHQDRRGPA